MDVTKRADKVRLLCFTVQQMSGDGVPYDQDPRGKVVRRGPGRRRGRQGAQRRGRTHRLWRTRGQLHIGIGDKGGG